MNAVYSLFPIAVGVTTVVVFLLIGIAFRSALIPARSGALVYVDNALHVSLHDTCD